MFDSFAIQETPFRLQGFDSFSIQETPFRLQGFDSFSIQETHIQRAPNASAEAGRHNQSQMVTDETRA